MAKITFCIFLALQSPVHTVREEDDRGDAVNVWQPPSLLHDTVMLLPPGIESRYSNLKQAGEGSFGIVYKATDRATGEPVAIKVMKDDVGGDELKLKCDKIKFLHEKVREVSQGQEIRHLMTCLEAQPMYVVYEWAGEEGSMVLPELTFDAARSLLKQVIIALHALVRGPRTSILHHDLKWKNVAVEGGCLKLIDLDDWIFGQWGNRLRITTHSPTFSPQEIVRKKAKTNFFCGLTESTARAQSGDQSACPAAYSFDIYSAGLMATQICGFEWMYFAKYMHTKDKSLKKMQQMDIAGYIEQDTVYATIPLYGILQLKMYLLEGNHLRTLLNLDPDAIEQEVENFKGETMCNSLASESFKLTQGCNQYKRNDATLMSHAAFAKEKFVSCKAKLTPDAIDIMESMLHSKPRLRPDPSRLLNSELFTGVATNCAYDDAEGSFEESERATEEEEEEEEEVGQDPSAIYKSVIDDLKDQIAASDEAVYSENAMNEHIEDKNVGSNQVDNVNEQPQVSELKCGGCVAPVPQMKRTKSRGMVPRTDKMGNILAWCYLDSFPKREPRGCKWMGKKEKGKFVLQCTCQSGEEVRGLPV